MASTYPKKLNGLCVGVLSGDRVLFQGPPDKQHGGYKQKILHLTGISAPKVDSVNGNDEKFGFAAREFLRSRLVGRLMSYVGKTLPFVVEKKVNETELGYVLYEEKDIITQLLASGFAKLRGEKINCDHMEDYKAAEEQAQLAERGIWSQEAKPEGALRYLVRTWTEKDFFQKNKNKKLTAIVEEIHPSKATLYFPDQGYLASLTFSEVQVVVLSEKTENGESKSNVRSIRSILESHFLQKQVNVSLTNVGQTLLGFLINKEGDDVRKVLLQNGFAKLGKDAMTGISTKQFMELKSIAQGALQQGKGLWKEQKINKSQTHNSKSYFGTVSQINSGDSLTIFNHERNDFVRIYLPNIRAPTGSQPYSYESKQYLRRKVIGQKVRVEIEFSRKITVKKFEGDVGELKDFIFASVFQNNLNISVYLLQNGLVSLQTPRVQEDVTKYFESLREAEAKGKKDRKGMFGNQNLKSPTFNDLSGGKGKKVDAGKCKNIFPFLKDQGHLTGVIDLVLNGSRFKVRFNNQHVMVIMVLEGVRCLPNETQFAKASEQALQFSKLNALQRDVEVELKKVDPKGVFHGKLSIGKKDYAIQLLERGMAFCMGGKFKNQKYDEAESIARKNKLGLWKYNLNLSSLRGESQAIYKQVSFEKKLTLLEVVSAQEFYLQSGTPAKPQIPQQPKPATTFEIGGIYCAKFTDDVYYRAKILKELGAGKYRVHYIDYGNYDNVSKALIGTLPEELKKVKSSLLKCSLYGLQGITNEGLNILKDYISAQLKVQFREQSQPQGKEQIEYRVIMSEKDVCINEQLLDYGEAECTIDNQVWRKLEDRARVSREGKWANDDN